MTFEGVFRSRLAPGILVLLALGCADIQLRPANIQEDVVSAKNEERPVEGEVSPKLVQDESDVTITALRTCETFRVQEIRKTSTRERYNASKGKTWTFGITGVAATGAGIGLMVDSANVHPKDETSRTYNPTGQGAALGYGVALTAGGVALTTIAIVDAVRASGTETRTWKNVTEDGDPLSKGPCLGVPAPGVEVFVSAHGNADADQVLAGTTDASGQYRLDLDAALPRNFAWQSKTLDVLVQGQVVGTLDGSRVFERREAATWSSLDKDRCEEPKHSSDCAEVEAILKQYPGGPNQMDAEALLSRAEAKLEVLRDDEAWASIPAEAKEACVERSTDPRNYNDTCSPFLGYQEAFPKGRHASEAEAILVGAEKAAARREAEALAAAKREEAAREAAAREMEADEKRQCLAECNMGCTAHTVEAKGMCRSGCSLRCGGRECEGSCAIGCSSWKVDQHQTCFSNCKAARQCSEGQ